MNNLKFNNVKDNKDLVAESTYNCLINTFKDDELDNILVAEIDPKYMGGLELCNHYNIPLKNGVNCLICVTTRKDEKQYVALLVPTGYRYDMSKTVRKYVNARMVSVAPLEYVLEKTKMEYGSINPIGLPENWKIFIDPKVLEVETIICGSGLQKSKLSLPSKYLLKFNNVEVLPNIAKE